MLYPDPMALADGTDGLSRLAVVANPVKVDLKELRTAVAAAEKAYGWAASLWLGTSVDDPGQGVAREAIAAGVDAVLVAGGDGTVRAVSEALLDSGMPMTLLPAGTGNILARNLGISVNRTMDAVATAFTGHDHAVDAGIAQITRSTGEVETHAFVVMIGIGLDAKMIAATNDELKKRVGWLAYVEATARIFKDVDAVRLRYSLDGSTERSTSAHTVLIGNCGALPGGVIILPEAEIDDGLLDVVAMRPRNLWGWVRIGTTVMWENGVLHRSRMGRRIIAADKRVRALRYFQGRAMTISLDKPEDFEIDGEGMGLVTGVAVRVAPAALIVRIPQSERDRL